MELIPKAEFSIVTRASKAWIPELIAAAGPEVTETYIDFSPPQLRHAYPQNCPSPMSNWKNLFTSPLLQLIFDQAGIPAHQPLGKDSAQIGIVAMRHPPRCGRFRHASSLPNLRIASNLTPRILPLFIERRAMRIKTPEGLERVKYLVDTYEQSEARQSKDQRRMPVSYDFLWIELGIMP
jgi:hypothetical protein